MTDPITTMCCSSSRPSSARMETDPFLLSTMLLPKRGQSKLLTQPRICGTSRPTPRKLRVQYPGAIYNLLNRGDRRENIFEDAEDRHRFLKTPAEARDKTGWQVHAYWLVFNHLHRKGFLVSFHLTSLLCFLTNELWVFSSLLLAENIRLSTAS